MNLYVFLSRKQQYLVSREYLMVLVVDSGGQDGTGETVTSALKAILLNHSV